MQTQSIQSSYCLIIPFSGTAIAITTRGYSVNTISLKGRKTTLCAMDGQTVLALVPIAQVVGITSSAFLSGKTSC